MKRSLFNEEERETIRNAVASAEAASSGEIATMVVADSDSYREAEVLGSVLLAGMFSLFLAIAIRQFTIWTYVPLVFLLFFPARLLLRRFPELKLPFAGKRRIEEVVQERAFRTFFEKQLYKTKDETGILIFLSELEHKVWILGDRGINEKIPAQEWQEIADTITTGIREGRACQSLCAAIDRCGRLLAKHFPRQADDLNELSDDLII